MSRCAAKRNYRNESRRGASQRSQTGPVVVVLYLISRDKWWSTMLTRSFECVNAGTLGIRLNYHMHTHTLTLTVTRSQDRTAGAIIIGTLPTYVLYAGEISSVWMRGPMRNAWCQFGQLEWNYITSRFVRFGGGVTFRAMWPFRCGHCTL